MGQTESTPIVLGEGTYNCAHKITITKNGKREDAVLRVAVIEKIDANVQISMVRDLIKLLKRNPNNQHHLENMRDFLFGLKRGGDSKVYILRGLDIVDAFQQFEAILGPSLLKTWAPSALYSVDEFKQLYNTQILNSLCSSVKNKLNDNFEVAVQNLEYLSGGEYNHRTRESVETETFCLFSLLWFMHVAQIQFKFRHHDLKPANIMIRKYDQVQNMVFYIDKKDFLFQTKIVPVIIDYDFATLYTSVRRTDRDNLGTYDFAPPDVLARHINVAIQRSDYYVHNPEVDGYDWWAIGCIFLHRFVDLYAFKSACKYHLFDMAKLLGTQKPLFVMHLYFSYAIAYLFNVNMSQDYSWAIIRVEPLWSNFVTSDIYLKFKQSVFDLKPFIPLISKLLSWTPEDRILDSFYTDPIFVPFMNKAKGIYQNEHVYSSPNNNYQEEISLDKYKNLLARISCGACFKGEAKNVCSCCTIPFCNKACQIKFH